MATLRASIALYDGVTSPLKHMATTMNVVLNTFESLQGATSKAIDTVAIQTAREEMSRFAVEIDAVENSLNQVNGQAQKLKQSFGNGAGAADRLISKAKLAALAVGGIHLAQNAIGVSDRMSGLNARLNLILDDGGSLEELNRKIMGSAQRSRSFYFDVADSVAKLASNAGDAFGGDIDQIIAFSEAVNKQFVLSGATAQEQSAAMLQLTQAMGSGVLRGDELNSIFEQAPGLIRNIADYMEVSIGEIRGLASEGKITADIVKNAMFTASEDINAAFESMPMTWSQIWTQVSNDALTAFRPVFDKISELANSDTMENGIYIARSAFITLGNTALMVIGWLEKGAAFVVDHWQGIATTVLWVAATFGIMKTVLLLYNIVQGITNGLQAVSAARSAFKAGATLAEAAATNAATGAQVGLNAALLACPLTWIVLAIVAVIAIIYMAVGAVNHFAGTSVSATGIVAGVFSTLFAHIANHTVIPMQRLFASFVNFFGNVFNDPVAAVKVLFYDMCLTVIGYILNMAQAIESLLNKIPGVTVEITSGLDGFHKGLEEAQQKVKDKSGWVEYVKQMDYMDLEQAARAGYAFGQGIDDKIKGVFSLDGMDAFNLGGNLDGIYAGVGDTAYNTAAMADEMDIAEENLAYMRDIAEREAINRYTTAQVTIHQNNENHISSQMDLDGVMDLFGTGLAEQMAVSGEGVHE